MAFLVSRLTDARRTFACREIRNMLFRFTLSYAKLNTLFAGLVLPVEIYVCIFVCLWLPFLNLHAFTWDQRKCI